MNAESTSTPTPSLDDVRAFWHAHPVGEASLAPGLSDEDYFRTFDELRESEDVEPPKISDAVHRFRQARGKRVLDVGCGNGYVLAQYAQHGAHVYGVDLTERAIDLARRRFHLAGLEGEFTHIDGTRLPFADASFDIVCSMGVLHHIPDPTPLVSELKRVLRPGGELVVMIYNRNSWRYRVLMPFRRRFGPAPYRGSTLQEVLNMNDGRDNPWADVYSQEEARGLLHDFVEHRFLVSKLPARELGLYLPLISGATARLPRSLVRALARRIGWNLYCTARKPVITECQRAVRVDDTQTLSAIAAEPGMCFKNSEARTTARAATGNNSRSSLRGLRVKKPSAEIIVGPTAAVNVSRSSSSVQ
jgi:SAM-dependent methyltransferase